MNQTVSDLKLEKIYEASNSNAANNIKIRHPSVRFGGEPEVNDDGVSISEYSIAPTRVSSQNFSKQNLSKLRRKFAGRIRNISQASQDTEDIYLRQYIKETENNRMLDQNIHLPLIHGRSQPSPSMHSKVFDLFTNFSNLHTGILEEEEYVRLEPTYRTGPNETIKMSLAEDKVRDILLKFLNNINVTQMMSSRSSVKSSMENLSFNIKSKMKDLVSDRYKLIVNCTAIESKYQGAIVATRCLWDSINDVCINVKEHQNNYTFVVNFFAIYHE